MFWEFTLRLLLAGVLGAVIGLDREYRAKEAGFRTHFLVSLGSALFMIVSQYGFAGVLGEAGVGLDPSRVAAQIVSGIGFLGAGTILFTDRKITGLTTAASLWNTACLGIAIGYGYYLIAIVGSIFVILVLIMMQRIIHVRISKKVEIKFVHRVETIEYINKYFDENMIQVVDQDFNVNSTDGQNIYTNVYTLHLPSSITYTDIVNHLSEHVNVMSIRTTNV